MFDRIRYVLVVFSIVALFAGCDRGRSSTEALQPPTDPAVQAPPLVARSALFGNPERAGGTISPDGRWLGYIAPRDGVLNVYVAPSGDPDAAIPVTDDRLRGVRGFQFAHTGNHVLYGQDVGGDENFQVFAVDLTTGEQRTLTPPGARASVAALSIDHPNEVLVMVNDRDPTYFDLLRIDLVTGEQNRIFENTRFGGVFVDHDFEPRYAYEQTEDGSDEYFVREANEWVSWMVVPQEDALTTRFEGITRSGETVYIRDSRGRDTAALFAIDELSGERRLLYADARADVGGIIAHPVTGVVQAASVNYLRNEWVTVDPGIARDLERLRAIAGDGQFRITSRTLADDRWVVVVATSTSPARFYVYDRAAGTADLWFETRPELSGPGMAPMHPVEIESRDGLTLVSYYTLPTESDPDGDGQPTSPLPMVLFVHGGPWYRDSYGFNRFHQWLANRGYAVLSVNFRGSTGFGKAFVNAGDREWGRKMHDDLLDGVSWAVDAGIARADEIAIMGGSYGGYATLAGLTMTPTEFACGVDIVGPSNLITLLSTIPPYWGPIKTLFTTRVGDPGTEAGRQLLAERSPLSYAHQIERPLLIGQGANDPRVKQAESDQIVAAMQAQGIPVTYILFPDEGHGFARPENALAFDAAAEEFLGSCLGGRVEAVGDDLDNSSITVPVGRDLLPGLAAALADG